MNVHRFSDRNFNQRRSGLSRHLTRIIICAVCCPKARHRNRNNLFFIPSQHIERLCRDKQSQCRIQTGATLIEVPIGEAVNVHFRDIGHDPDVHDVTYENAQARERTQVLMDIANREAGMVIGTGDMSELALGWATYNGDHMSMYGVNASVPKTLVRHLVQHAADTTENESLRQVLYDVLDTPVSPELLPPKDGDIAQKTEDLVGPYELHDFYLYYMLRFGFSPEKIFTLAVNAFAGVYEKETILKWLKIFYRRFFSQQFKRSCLPDGPKCRQPLILHSYATTFFSDPLPELSRFRHKYALAPPRQTARTDAVKSFS